MMRMNPRKTLMMTLMGMMTGKSHLRCGGASLLQVLRVLWLLRVLLWLPLAAAHRRPFRQSPSSNPPCFVRE